MSDLLNLESSFLWLTATLLRALNINLLNFKNKGASKKLTFKFITVSVVIHIILKNCKGMWMLV